MGGSIVTGYKWAQDNEIDISVVMAGDAQMDPQDLTKLLDPVVEEEVDYSKGNRLFTGKAWNIIPKTRYLGNAALPFLTKIASGYWHVADSQSSYGAVTLKVLKTIDLDSICKRCGMPNDLLVRLNIYIDLLQKMALQDVLELEGDEFVLDFGSGSGRIDYWIAPRVKKVVGLEVTPEMIELAEKHRTASNVEFILYDGTHFPDLPCLFDLILSMGVL